MHLSCSPFSHLQRFFCCANHHNYQDNDEYFFIRFVYSIATVNRHVVDAARSCTPKDDGDHVGVWVTSDHRDEELETEMHTADDQFRHVAIVDEETYRWKAN